MIKIYYLVNLNFFSGVVGGYITVDVDYKFPGVYCDIYLISYDDTVCIYF